MSIKSEKQFEVIIEKLDQLLEENKQLKILIAQKDDELSLQKEQIEFLTQKLYGPKKETLNGDPNQGNLFNDSLFSEPEQTGDQSDEDEVITKTERRRKKRKGLKDKQLSSLSTVDHIHELESCTCPTCMEAMKEISTQLIRQEVKFIPARVENHRHFQKTYACANCEKSGMHTPFAKSEIPRLPLNNTAASASLIAETMYQKFEQKVPGYRQEAYWNLLGYPIPRHTIANWHIKTSQYYLEALVAEMRQELLNQKVLHADETTFKVLNDKDRQKSYMWLFSTGKYSDRAIHIYKLGPSRSGSVPRDFLEGYTGYLHSDGFSGYNNLPGMTMIACLAHIRRKFYDARPKNYSSKSVAHKGVKLCNELFALDKTLKGLSVSERYHQRLVLVKPKLEAFFDWCESLTAHGKLGIAINYALNQKERMMNVLKDGRLVLSNNLAERGIKSLVMGRKNWLFSKSFDGAHAVATILSLVETAKSNGLHPRKYVDYLLT
ncbi:Transposase [Alkalibacterium gilvum]|uniref:Transposase n=1 Tax=Alkalibacterium gilvum TaxID=1130080 RepID=A0A1H6VMG0_9LACT|nr:IS66 family transposase [Alkalibacterium gilvum]SEJ05801.1 Transposase [Alkalibacterium gilvum]